MAAIFNPSMIMTNDFLQENHIQNLGPSSRDIEKVLGIKMDRDLAAFLDSMTDQEAYDLLCELLSEFDI